MPCSNCAAITTPQSSLQTADGHTLCLTCGGPSWRGRCPDCRSLLYDRTATCQVCAAAAVRNSAREAELRRLAVLTGPWLSSTGMATYPGLACAAFPNATRTFGLELEALSPILASQTPLARLGSITSDGSIRTFNFNTARNAFELRSHVTSGSHTELYVRELAAVCAQVGVEVNPSCGLHIHVGMAGTSEQQRNNLIFWWGIWEPIFFATQPASRRINTYCRSVQDFTTVDSLRRTRYTSMNIAAYDSHNTYEWRLGAATTKAEDILLLITLIDRFVTNYIDRPLPANAEDPAFRALCDCSDRELFLSFIKSLNLPGNILRSAIRAIRANCTADNYFDLNSTTAGPNATGLPPVDDDAFEDSDEPDSNGDDDDED